VVLSKLRKSKACAKTNRGWNFVLLITEQENFQDRKDLMKGVRYKKE